jgi:hypothetical protein
VGEGEVLQELGVGGGLLHGVEVGAVEVLHHGLLERGEVVGLADQHGHGGQAGSPRRPPPALAGDELVLARAQLADEQGLEHAEGGHRGGEGGEGLLVERPPGLARVRAEALDRHLPEGGPADGRRGRGGGGRCLRGEERPQAPTEAALAHR